MGSGTYKINSTLSRSIFASLVSTSRSHSSRACLKFRMIPTARGSDAEIIQHLPTLMVGDPVNCLCVDDQRLLDNKVWNILAYQLAFIQYSVSLLLDVRMSRKRNSTHKQFS